MANINQIYEKLIEQSSDLGSIKSDVQSFKNEYAEGKQKAQVHALETRAKIQEIHESLRYKMDERKYGPIRKMNWMMSNTKSIGILIMLLFALGFISVRSELFKVFGL